MAILRLSHVEIRVPDLELATAYYNEVVGMFETAREGDRVFLKCWDEHQHHSVVLQSAPTYGLGLGSQVRESGGPRGGLTFVDAIGSWFNAAGALVPREMV